MEGLPGKGLRISGNRMYEPEIKRHKTSAVNLDRGRITDRITDSGNIQRVGKTVNTGVMTQKINMPESEGNDGNFRNNVLPTAEYSETSSIR